MKHLNLVYLLVAFCFLMGSNASAQTEKPYPAGSITDFVSKLKNSSSRERISGKPLYDLPVGNGKSFKGVQNTNLTLGGEQTIIGKIENESNSTFILHYTESGVRGKIILKDKKAAYEYSSQNGAVSVKEIPIDKVLCIEFNESDPSTDPPVTGSAPPAGDPAYDLQSLPGAAAVVKLDFDGEYVSGTAWNSGNPINAVASAFNAAEITEIWEMVSEDFRPFNLNITTSETVYQAAAVNLRMKCVFTPTNTAAPGAGGVAYVGVFTYGAYYSPCWVFNGGIKGAGEAASHEIGHTMGLVHDGTSSVTYYTGHGNWGPIMGATYTKSVVQWSQGEYSGANNQEDDVYKIAANNGFSYRTDEDVNTLASARTLALDGSGNMLAANAGIITTRTDVDYFKVVVSLHSTVNVTVTPNAFHPDLNIVAKLANSSGTILSASDPSGMAAATINSNVAPGTYYILIDGVGEGNPLNTGYSDYGSLGKYTLSGFVKDCRQAMTPPTVSGTSMLCNNGPTVSYNVSNVQPGSTYAWSITPSSIAVLVGPSNGFSYV